MGLTNLAWIGGLLGIASVVVLVWELTLILKLRQSMAAAEDRLRTRLLDQVRDQQASDARARLFVLGVESAEAAVRGLLSYSHALTQHATSVVFDADQERSSCGTSLDDMRRKVEDNGLFLPPEVDRPFHDAFKACVALVGATERATKLQTVSERRELCRPAVQTVDQEIHSFVSAVRVWKKRNWFRVATGEEPPDSFAELTNPSITNPKPLSSDDDALQR